MWNAQSKSKYTNFRSFSKPGGVIEIEQFSSFQLRMGKFISPIVDYINSQSQKEVMRVVADHCRTDYVNRRSSMLMYFDLIMTGKVDEIPIAIDRTKISELYFLFGSQLESDGNILISTMDLTRMDIDVSSPISFFTHYVMGQRGSQALSEHVGQ